MLPIDSTIDAGIIASSIQPINDRERRKYFDLFPFIIAFDSSMHCLIPLDGSSAKMKNAWLYLIDAIIPGTINRRVHRQMKRFMKKNSPRALRKCSNPRNTSATCTLCILKTARKNIDRPSSKAPDTSNM